MTDSSSSSIRERSRALLLTSLESGSSTLSTPAPSSSALSSLSTSLEQSIYTSCNQDTSNAYRDAIRQRSLFLKKDNPTALIPALLSGSMTPDQFAAASHTELQSPQQALSDAQLQQENIQQSMGLDSDTADGRAFLPEQVVDDSQVDGASGQIGVAEDMLGAEGEFKARGQPKVGRANEGIEFETPQ